MLLSRISLAALRTFSEVARQGSLSRAAQYLCISPSAVSHQMKLLEEQLQTKLFIRRTHGVELTEAGQKLSAQSIAAIQQLENGLQQATGKSKQTLLVACVPAFSQLWLIPRLERLYAKCPDVNLSIVEQDHLADFTQQNIDVHLHFGSGEFPGLKSVLLMAEKVTPVVSGKISGQPTSDHLLVSNNTRRLSYIGFDEDRPGGISWQGWFNRASLELNPAQSETQFSHVAPMINATCQGHGMALGWINLIQPLLENGRLVRLSETDVPLKYSYYAVAPEQNFEKKQIATFIEWLKTEAGPQ